MNANTDHVWRDAAPRLGKAWVERGSRLRPGIVVEVTEFYRDRLACWIRTPWGVELRTFSYSLHFGYEFRTSRGEWIGETDPRAQRWLRRVRAELLNGSAPRHAGDYGAKLELATVERILRRNGWRETKS